MTDSDSCIQAEATRRYYEENASSYAAATLDADLTALWEPFVARLSAGATIVDLGCGGGRDLHRFVRSGLEPVGLDRSYALCRIASDVSRRPVVVGDLSSLPFRSGAFEGVWSAAALVHLCPHEARRAFSEIKRVLQPGGIALITLKEGDGEEMDEYGRYTRLYSEEAVRAALAATDLKVVDQVRTRELRDRRVILWMAFFARSSSIDQNL